jgi:hypothetical protein
MPVIENKCVDRTKPVVTRTYHSGNDVIVWHLCAECKEHSAFQGYVDEVICQ